MEGARGLVSVGLAGYDFDGVGCGADGINDLAEGGNTYDE